MLLPKGDMSFLRLRIRLEGTTADRIAAIGENPLQDALAGRFQLARDLIHFGVEMSDKAVLNLLRGPTFTFSIVILEARGLQR